MPDPTARPAPSTRAAVLAFVADLVLVLLFATIGRLSHEEGVTVGGVLDVAWPFVVALLVGWLVARRRTGWPVALPGATTVWLVTAVLGLVLRVLSGGGFAWSFGVVTVVVLGVFLLGWRCATGTALCSRRCRSSGRARFRSSP